MPAQAGRDLRAPGAAAAAQRAGPWNPLPHPGGHSGDAPGHRGRRRPLSLAASTLTLDALIPQGLLEECQGPRQRLFVARLVETTALIAAETVIGRIGEDLEFGPRRLDLLHVGH